MATSEPSPFDTTKEDPYVFPIILVLGTGAGGAELR